MAGYRGVSAFAEFVALFSERLKSVGAFFSPSRQCYTPPRTTTFHDIFSTLPERELDNAVAHQIQQRVKMALVIAVDGKRIRGTFRHGTEVCHGGCFGTW